MIFDFFFTFYLTFRFQDWYPSAITHIRMEIIEIETDTETRYLMRNQNKTETFKGEKLATITRRNRNVKNWKTENKSWKFKNKTKLKLKERNE